MTIEERIKEYVKKLSDFDSLIDNIKNNKISHVCILDNTKFIEARKGFRNDGGYAIWITADINNPKGTVYIEESERNNEPYQTSIVPINDFIESLRSLKEENTSASSQYWIRKSASPLYSIENVVYYSIH